MDCPIDGCNYKAQTENGLFRHLMTAHGKNDVVQALINLQKVLGKVRITHYCGS